MSTYAVNEFHAKPVRGDDVLRPGAGQAPETKSVSAHRLASHN
jgi:hypothetical protein